MNITKRIFSVFLAFMLAFSFVPVMSIEAEATLKPVGEKYSIVFSSGTGKATESEAVDIEKSVKLPSGTACGFKKSGYTLTGWMINGEFYNVGDTYKFDEADGVIGDYDYIIKASAVWESEKDNEAPKDYHITITYHPGTDKDNHTHQGQKKFKEYSTTLLEGKPGYYIVTLPECPFDPEGYSFKGWYVDGAEGKLFQPGEQVAVKGDIAVTAMWKAGGAGVTVNNVGDVKSIEIKTKPKTTYKVNDTLDTDGLVITATKKDGSTQDITSGFTVSPADGTKLEKAGTVTVTVTYKNLTATFNVTVNSNSSSSSSAASSSKPASSSSSSSSVAPSTSSSSSSSESSSETSSESSSAPEVEEPEVFEPISLAYSISGDVPVTGIEFLLGEDIGENPQLRVMAIDGSSATDAATSAFIANGDALAAFDLSLLVDGLAYHDDSMGTVTYSLNGTQTEADCRFDSYVLAMAHVTSIDDYDGEYYMTDGENTYLYTPETDFKAAVSNVALVEEDGVNRLVIRSVSGLSSFAYQAAANVIVEVKLLPSASDSTGSIDVTSLSPVLLVQLEVGEGSGSGFAIPFWVWIIVGVVVLLVIVLVALYLINRSNEQKRFEETLRHSAYSSNSTITGFDDEE